MKSLFGNAMHHALDANREKIDRLEKLITFLADAEQGKADYSDIDTICAQSSARYAQRRQNERQQGLAAISTLNEAMKTLGSMFRRADNDSEEE